MYTTKDISVNNVATKLIDMLPDITIHRYNAYSTNSIYLKLDYGVGNSVRISDHFGKEHLQYKFNVLTFLDKSKMIDGKYYYAPNDLALLVAEIFNNYYGKMSEISNYDAYMSTVKNSIDYSKGFWRKAYLVRKSSNNI